MGVLFLIIIANLIVSLIAFLGVLTLFLKDQVLNKLLLILVAFSAGVLIGGAFFHLLPEALTRVRQEAILNVFLFLVLGFCVLFILEQFLSWHHHHAREHPELKSFSLTILIADGVHNFIDGLIIAASFLVNFQLGLATTLAVIFHEIPQEIGDFGVLVYGGFTKFRALLFNFLSGIMAIFGGIVGFFLSQRIEEGILFLLPFAAGNFIYIAASDLIPEIKHKVSLKKSLLHFIIFLVGIGIMISLK